MAETSFENINIEDCKRELGVVKYLELENSRQIKNLENILLSAKHLYYSPWEISTRTERGLCDIIHTDHFRERYLRLIKGLPNKSVKTIFNVISRLSMLKNITGPVDIFSEEEKKLLDRTDEFFRSIVKISDNEYLYDRYFLPVKSFEASVFLYRHAMDMVKDIDSLKNRNILDVGGYIGDSALILSEFTGKKVYSFEALNENFNIMIKTLQMNKILNVVPVNVGVGEHPGRQDRKSVV